MKGFSFCELVVMSTPFLLTNHTGAEFTEQIRGEKKREKGLSMRIRYEAVIESCLRRILGCI